MPLSKAEIQVLVSYDSARRNLQRAQTDVRRLRREFDEGEKTFREFTDAMQADAARAAQAVNQSFATLQGGGLAGQQRSRRGTFTSVERDIRASGVAARKAARGMNNYTQTVFQATQAVEDFLYAGFRGASNNLAFILQDVARQGRGAGGALGFVARNVTPLTLGVTALAVAAEVPGPKLISAFRSGAEGAEEAKNKAQEYASALASFEAVDPISFASDPAELQKQEALLRGLIKGSTADVQGAREEVESLEAAYRRLSQSSLSGLDVPQVDEQRISQAREALELAQENLRVAEGAKQEDRDAVAIQREQLKVIQEQIRQRQAAVELTTLLNSVGIQTAAQVKKAEQDDREARKRREEAIKELQKLRQTAAEVQIRLIDSDEERALATLRREFDDLQARANSLGDTAGQTHEISVKRTRRVVRGRRPLRFSPFLTTSLPWTRCSLTSLNSTTRDRKAKPCTR